MSNAGLGVETAFITPLTPGELASSNAGPTRTRVREASIEIPNRA